MLRQADRLYSCNSGATFIISECRFLLGHFWHLLSNKKIKKKVCIITCRNKSKSVAIYLNILHFWVVAIMSANICHWPGLSLRLEDFSLCFHLHGSFRGCFGQIPKSLIIVLDWKRILGTIYQPRFIL